MSADTISVWDREIDSEAFHCRRTLRCLGASAAAKRRALAGRYSVLLSFKHLIESSCGVGMVACLDEDELREVLFAALEACTALGLRDVDYRTMSASTRALTAKIYAEYRAAEEQRRASSYSASGENS